jgi:di/tricarboxylate transporter
MTDQSIVFTLIVLIFIFFIWNKVRYDLVAFAALVIASVLGVVSKEQVFDGFGHPAVIIVALVLVISRGLIYSGAVEIITKQASKFVSGIQSHIAVMGSVSALLSSVINNIAALAILMPADMQLNKKNKRSVSSTLMPLSFASILGGMVTMIGTAPNVVIAQYRGDALGTPYSMFDFSLVGGVVAISGIIFIALFGWRLVPQAENNSETLKDIREYIANLEVDENSEVNNKYIYDLIDVIQDSDVCIIGIIRDGKQITHNLRYERLTPKDVLIVEGEADAIDQFGNKTNTAHVSMDEADTSNLESPQLSEVVVPINSNAIGKTAISMGLLARYGISLLGISRAGKKIISSVGTTKIFAGDILLLHGDQDQLSFAIDTVGFLSLADREIEIPQRKKAWMAIAAFVIAIVLATFDFVYLPIALSAVIVFYIAMGIVPAQQVYQSISWPIIILLGSMIPIGNALTATGGSETIANLIINWTDGLSPVVILAILLIVTMTLSDVLNNVATVLIAAPISIDLAQKLSVNPDAFLMAVAVGASCAFLTPIGHQNNTLIMGPGGYKFSDYWRLGLPLEIIVAIVGVPSILYFWPL